MFSNSEKMAMRQGVKKYKKITYEERMKAIKLIK